MASKLNSSVSYGVVLFFLLAECSSSFPSLSDGIFENQESGARTRALLQIKKSCPVDFEHQNYTIITSQCRRPKFPANNCCTAFKEFACPYAVELNDLTNDCATIMFSYIRTYGNYPPGLFANKCRDTKQGLDCTSVNISPSSPSSEDSVGNNGRRQAKTQKLLSVVGCFLILLFQL
ncbi:hypothetical protein CDL15_Pgr002816 [Punica granatum]|uniref:GPI-anchored protein LLG1-like domain-containing protein n=1 Tax=Punica granatum TaxID=22663 RepID=A0A218X0E9_PUNGR|nr:hypothetical protein CDL15_Pgr002816 [Punica granatum]